MTLNAFEAVEFDMLNKNKVYKIFNVQIDLFTYFESRIQKQYVLSNKSINV